MKHFYNKSKLIDKKADHSYGFIGYTLQDLITTLREYNNFQYQAYNQDDTLYLMANYAYAQYTRTTDPMDQYCFSSIYRSSSEPYQRLKIGFLYETEYREDELLIQRNNKWYGLLTPFMSNSMITSGSAYSRTRLRYTGACGYPYTGDTSDKSDLQKAIDNGTVEIVFIYKDFPSDGNYSDWEGHYGQYWSQIKWGTFNFLTITPFDKSLIDNDDLRSYIVPQLIGMSFQTELGKMRKKWIKFFKDKQVTWRNFYQNLLKWFNPENIPNGNTSDVMVISNQYYEPLRYVLHYMYYQPYYKMKKQTSLPGTFTYDMCESIFLKYVSTDIYSKLFYREFYSEGANTGQEFLVDLMFPKHIKKTTFPAFNVDILNFNDMGSTISYYVTLLDRLEDYIIGEEETYLFPERPMICDVTENGLKYHSYNEVIRYINLSLEYHQDVEFHEFDTLSGIGQVIVLANQILNNRADELIMFGPDLKCQIKFDSCGYNVIPHISQNEDDVFGNVAILFDFITDENEQYYMRVTNWHFLIETTSQIVPWYFVRSNDYSDWINKFNENRNATTAYREIESGSNTTIYFKDSETGMTGAIEASNSFKTLFEDTSYLQNDDLDGIGEICSSILAVEKDFYESLNENSGSTNDFKTMNQNYVNYLGEQVEQLHLMITDQEEISNEIRIQFTEILATIDNFYNSKTPIDVITVEDIENANMNKLPNNYVYKMFSVNENLPYTHPDNIDSTGPVSFLENIINSYILPGYNYVLKECCYMEEPSISDGTNKILEYSQMMSEIQSERNRIQRTNKNSILLVFNQNINGTFFEILYNEQENSEKTCESTLGFFICTNDLEDSGRIDASNDFQIIIYPKMYEGEPLDWHRDNYYATKLYLMNCDNLSVQFINEINLCPIGYNFNDNHVIITTNKDEIIGKNMIGYYKIETN